MSIPFKLKTDSIALSALVSVEGEFEVSDDKLKVTYRKKDGWVGLFGSADETVLIPLNVIKSVEMIEGDSKDRIDVEAKGQDALQVLGDGLPESISLEVKSIYRENARDTVNSIQEKL